MTGKDELLRRGPQGPSHARNRAPAQCRLRARGRAPRTHAPVAGPVAVSLLVEAAAVACAVLLGLPGVAVVAVIAAVAVLTAVLARRTVSSLVAGAGIRVAQPYQPGEQVRVFVPALDSVEDAEIVRVGPANTALLTDRGLVLVPNADMLRPRART